MFIVPLQLNVSGYGSVGATRRARGTLLIIGLVDEDRHDREREPIPAPYPGAPPPSEAYGRVSNPERYRILHRWARELLDRLSAEFTV